MSIDYNIEELGGAQNALSKMARAEKRGTGCHISADEIRSLSLTIIGSMWNMDDPRPTKGNDPEAKHGES